MKKIPRATYRLQFHAGFTFDHAAGIADYLSALGISHIYASPYLQAVPGSTHGYDVTDPGRPNIELGAETGHDRMCHALARNDLGQVLDVVPNHMAVSHPQENQWWWDVLKNGPESRYAHFFDIDWEPPERRLAGRVVLPVLEDHFGRVIEEGKIRVEPSQEGVVCRYGEFLLPLCPQSLEQLMADAGIDAENPDFHMLAGQLNADFDALAELLENQHYRLVFWRAGARDLNYRRFFAINELAGIRIEDETVFDATHRLILDWLLKGVVGGIRIDHPDGLRDPQAYFDRLRTAVPEAWVVVEKILHPGEDLPRQWPVDGTTGYDFLCLAGGLFVDPAGEAPLTEFYAEFTGEQIDYADLVRKCKQQVIDELLGADINRLTEILIRICEKHRRFRDYTRPELDGAIRFVLAEMRVYRTYVRTDGRLREADRRIIGQAISEAASRHPEIDPRLFGFIQNLLLCRYPENPECDFMLRFQQLSGPVMAKGVEDTAFYRYHRLSGLNEVGGDPSHFGLSLSDFHAAMAKRAETCPAAMLATSTHDTKRSEDMRARLALISEIPRQWAEAVRRWSVINKRHKKNHLPDANAEYLLYQTLVGAWPIDANRAAGFMEKAAREAKHHTTWERPDTEYEKALQGFVSGILADKDFLSDLEAFVMPLVLPGRINSLSQTVIKLTAPGVPDLYQGSELWDLSLVDPDNRRPVDFELRRRRLSELEGMRPEQVMAEMDKGLPKLYVIWRTLQLRKARPELFAPGAGYQPLAVEGGQKDKAGAYLRGEGAAVVFPRRVLSFSGDWQETRVELPEGRWQNIFDQEITDVGRVFLENLLARLPVALLVKQ